MALKLNVTLKIARFVKYGEKHFGKKKTIVGYQHFLTIESLQRLFSIGLSQLGSLPPLWLERPPREQEVVASIPGRDRPKSLKVVIVAFPLGAEDYGNCTTTGLPVSG